MRYLFIFPLVAALTGCAAPTLYQWGGYDQALYSGYKDPAQMESMRVKLEAHIAAMEQSKQKVAPGLYAELGTLYLQAGSSTKAAGLWMRPTMSGPPCRCRLPKKAITSFPSTPPSTSLSRKATTKANAFTSSPPKRLPSCLARTRCCMCPSTDGMRSSP
jgi:hypothetical protein